MFHIYVASVLSECCVYLQCFSSVFSGVFQTHVSSVSSVFFLYCKYLHLDVSKIDRVLHMRCTWEVGQGVGPHVSVGDAGAVERRPGSPSASSAILLNRLILS